MPALRNVREERGTHCCDSFGNSKPGPPADRLIMIHCSSFGTSSTDRCDSFAHPIYVGLGMRPLGF